MSKFVVIGPRTCPYCLIAIKKLMDNFGNESVSKDCIEDHEDENAIIEEFMEKGFDKFPVILYENEYYNGVGKALDEFIEKVKVSS